MKWEVCYECDGYGHVPTANPTYVITCEKCEGTGVIQGSKEA